MKIDRYVLTHIYEVAHREMVNGVKSKHETHQQHLSRCWTIAVINVLKLNNVSVETDKNLSIEPVEE